MRYARTLPLLALLLGACAARTVPEEESAPETSPVPSALASVSVRNDSPHRLTIRFHPVRRDRPGVGIGSVDPGAERRLAPVPATEPIVLSARTARGEVLALPPRSFALDEQWTWHIPADAFPP